jgi:hypothetical protein
MGTRHAIQLPKWEGNVGYDVELVQLTVEPEGAFPLSADQASSGEDAYQPFASVEQVRNKLLELEGARSGPDASVDYLGRGLNHARFVVTREGIHVDNHLNATELVKVYTHLKQSYPALLIRDLQSGQLHNAASYAEWWTRPL